MKRKLEDYKRFVFLGIIIISLGIVLTNTLTTVKSLGIVLIAVGGLFFIIGMSKKRKSDSNSK